jgi:RimJ/RimL family protein N-acetyltransferase
VAIIEPKTITLKNGKIACIRTRTPKDTERVPDFLESVFSDDVFFLTTLEEIREDWSTEKSLERTRLFSEHELKLLLVAEIDDRIVSMSDIECGEKKRIQHVGKIGLSIRREYRGIGLGTAIMETMIDWATAHPVIEKLALGVWAKNERAIRLYKKTGFIEEGRKVREIKYADGSYDDCICMYRFVK